MLISIPSIRRVVTNFAANADNYRTVYTVWVLSTPFGVVTTTTPVVAPLGTVVVISVSDTTSNVAAVPLKVTSVVPVSLFPRI
jgi:hypothetical protein